MVGHATFTEGIKVPTATIKWLLSCCKYRDLCSKVHVPRITWSTLLPIGWSCCASRMHLEEARACMDNTACICAPRDLDDLHEVLTEDLVI